MEAYSLYFKYKKSLVELKTSIRIAEFAGACFFIVLAFMPTIIFVSFTACLISVFVFLSISVVIFHEFCKYIIAKKKEKKECLCNFVKAIRGATDLTFIELLQVVFDGKKIANFFRDNYYNNIVLCGLVGFDYKRGKQLPDEYVEEHVKNNLDELVDLLFFAFSSSELHTEYDKIIQRCSHICEESD